ncbi:MAG: hypothetical protein ACI956_002616, partial [Nonlabens sp.]
VILLFDYGKYFIKTESNNARFIEGAKVGIK